MLISWWSTSHQVGTTANMLCAASCIAATTDLQTLLFHTHKERSTLESSLSYYIREREDNYSFGMAELENRYMSGILKNPQDIKDNTRELIPNRMFLLEGKGIGDSQVFDKFLPDLVDLINKAYPLILVDIPAGPHKPESLVVLKKSDMVVINLTQNVAVLDDFFHKVLPSSEVLREKELFYAIGNYENNSHTTVNKISKTYGIKADRIGVIPRNVKLLDESNNGKLPDFVFKSLAVASKDWSYDDDQFFGQQIKETVKSLLSLSSIPLIK